MSLSRLAWSRDVCLMLPVLPGTWQEGHGKRRRRGFKPQNGIELSGGLPSAQANCSAANPRPSATLGWVAMLSTAQSISSDYPAETATLDDRTTYPPSPSKKAVVIGSTPKKPLGGSMLPLLHPAAILLATTPREAQRLV